MAWDVRPTWASGTKRSAMTFLRLSGPTLRGGTTPPMTPLEPMTPSVDVTAELRIERPRAAVAAFMFDPANDRKWTAGLVASRTLTSGPLRVGSQLERTSQFLGRTFSYMIEVLQMDRERFVELRATNPFEMRIRYELEDTPSGTLVRIHAVGAGSGFFRMATPLLAVVARRRIAGDLKRLRRCLTK